MRSARIIPTLLFLLCASSATRAQPMADRLPPSTLVYTAWSPGAALQNTKAAKMLADERLVQPWRAVMQKVMLSIPDDVGGGAKVSEHFPRLLADAAQCEGCFALLELKPDRGELAPQAVLVLNLGARRADFEAHFKPIHARLKERLGERIHMMKLENSWLWMKTTKDRPDYTWGFLGDSFIFYFGDGAERFLPTLSTKREKSLKDAPAFADCMAKLPPGDALLTTYVDVKSGLGLLHGLLKETNDDGLRVLTGNWHKVTKELGLDNVRALGERTTIEDDQFVTRSLLHTEGPPHGLAAALVGPAVDDAMLKVVPPDAMFVTAARIDLAKTYEQIKSGAIAVAGEDATKAFGDLEDAAAGFGVPVKNLLGPLGDQWVLYEAASTGGFFFTGLTLVVDVKDPDRLGRTLAALKQLLAHQVNGEERPATVGSYDADGVTIQYLQAAGSFVPFTPAWAVADHKLVIALYPQVVEDALRQLKAERSVLDDPQFVQTRKQIGGGGGPLFYMSGPEFVRSLYPIVLPFVSAMREFIVSDVADDRSIPTAELIPSLQRLLQYVGSDGVCLRLTPDGILRTKSVANPLLSPLTLTDSVPLWVVAALPTLGSAKVNADRTRSANNLRQIGQGIVLYANDNKGKLPPDLAAVLKVPDIRKETFQSPFGDGKGDGDYKYLYSPVSITAVPPDVALAYDAAEMAKGDGASVLYADGHVEWLDTDGVTAALDKAAKWRAEQAGKK